MGAHWESFLCLYLKADVAWSTGVMSEKMGNVQGGETSMEVYYEFQYNI